MNLNFQKIFNYLFSTAIAIFIVFSFFKRIGSSCNLTSTNFLLVLLCGVCCAVIFNFIKNKYLNINQNIYLVVLLILLMAVVLVITGHFVINIIC